MKLSDAEQRELASIERHLAAENPALARMLSMPGRPWPIGTRHPSEAEPPGGAGAVITLSLPIVGQQTPPLPEQPRPKRRSLGSWLMVAGTATVAAALLTGTVAIAVGGFLLIAVGKYTADG
ncbi:DUF3040 domain-containing protein [Arthrobacter sp. CAU 1506]|uniref:DUF3040 domain-containing protein n=1 Tax=Arthrobacter sp. CAU 1506 TaxID=2560052 RepID=UPI0010AB8ED9|nr:DUF3040 domain-containing protein [Arthrobacter sp. CAU 1506]TJY66341.1 DUF3040 domain-containing protein [Arthrobacter sp. CAU 1506]